MSVMVQIRNMPDDVHREMKSRAAKAGMSLSDYLLNEIRFIAERPTMEAWIERARSLPPVESPMSAAELIRAERNSR